MDARCLWSAVVEQSPDFLIRAFSSCAVVSFAVRWATCIDSSDIVFMRSATDVLSACVAVARFASARVWYYWILVKSATLACAACTCDTQPLVFEVLEGIQVSLKSQVKWALKLLHVLSLRALRDHSWQSSWYSPHFSMFAYAIETIWSSEYGFCTANASWFH